jgi:hypothetical protein
MAIHMQRSKRMPAGAVLSGLLAAMIAAFYVTNSYAEELKIQRIRIESTPGGAVVSTIVGKRGVTPLSITERDIYPNTYPDAKVDLYGKVVVSKPGCETITRRVTLDDIKNGLDIQLDCTASTPVADRKAVEKPQAIPKPEQPVTSVAEPLSERRLRQLKVLEELLDDKLISAEEERAIRKRIFERLNH